MKDQVEKPQLSRVMVERVTQRCKRRVLRNQKQLDPDLFPELPEHRVNLQEPRGSGTR